VDKQEHDLADAGLAAVIGFGILAGIGQAMIPNSAISYFFSIWCFGWMILALVNINPVLHWPWKKTNKSWIVPHPQPMTIPTTTAKILGDPLIPKKIKKIDWELVFIRVSFSILGIASVGIFIYFSEAQSQTSAHILIPIKTSDPALAHHHAVEAHSFIRSNEPLADFDISHEKKCNNCIVQIGWYGDSKYNIPKYWLEAMDNIVKYNGAGQYNLNLGFKKYDKSQQFMLIRTTDGSFKIIPENHRMCSMDELGCQCIMKLVNSVAVRNITEEDDPYAPTAQRWILDPVMRDNSVYWIEPEANKVNVCDPRLYLFAFIDANNTASFELIPNDSDHNFWWKIYYIRECTQGEVNSCLGVNQ
jgi:hypothetical protein